MGFTIVNEEVEDRTLPDDSIHKAEVTDITLRDVNGVDRRTGEPYTRQFLDFWFMVTGSSQDKFLGRKVKGSIPFVMNTLPNNAFRLWSERLLGRTIAPSTPVDTDDLLGLSCEIVIAHEKSKDGSRVFEKVADILELSGDYNDEPPF